LSSNANEAIGSAAITLLFGGNSTTSVPHGFKFGKRIKNVGFFLYLKIWFHYVLDRWQPTFLVKMIGSS